MTLPGVGAMPPEALDPYCTRCPRLAQALAEVRHAYPGYHGRPVAPFGDARARLLIVGLAPGLHGANRTGRPFTGDHAGLLLYRTLHRFGFATGPESISAEDTLRLLGCRITNAVKCWPPANKPLPAEVRHCNGYLRAELGALGDRSVVLALGAVAHGAVLKALGLPQATFVFAHGARHALPGGLTLHDSYHCSRYNTQTKRLTEAMFETVVGRIAAELGG
ncbi:MAG: uracil-DNA glycosylase [Burkholderiales bacterium]|jgi:uracil-DNA glycosylase family 4|nr:uracil-DNA glycosylase [Burkholderiales bacterium]